MDSLLQHPAIPVIIALLGTGLQMTQSKSIGVLLIAVGLGWLWYLVTEPVRQHFPFIESLVLVVGWTSVVIGCFAYWQWMRRTTTSSPFPTSPLQPTASVVNKGEGIAAGRDVNVGSYIRSLTINHPSPPEPHVEIACVIVENQREGDIYRTIADLKLVSPYPVGNLLLVVHGRSIREIVLIPKRGGVSFSGASGVRENLAFTNLQNAYGDLQLTIISSEPSGPTNKFEIEYNIQ